MFVVRGFSLGVKFEHVCSGLIFSGGVKAEGSC
jgi:hypothetical protein